MALYFKITNTAKSITFLDSNGRYHNINLIETPIKVRIIWEMKKFGILSFCFTLKSSQGIFLNLVYRR